ncbi:hypothetical protein [Roseibium salinum]|uniref:Uncharacterized protein n=1 Tax=Roseibium salinum TaxID=1604349 RepID=A0ABT3R0V5_9HYPH|nr:hypothetical protein [Roseibium sp. DSM 29163]MCX2722848.1 hypothetical protein [Roseibium sp. DSM 29163]
MLETVGSYAEAQFDAPQIFQLAPDVCFVVWDTPHPVNAAPRLEERSGRRFGSLASLRLARLDGRSRLLWIFSLKEQAALHLRLSAGAVGSGADLHVKEDQEQADVDPYALTAGLTQNACAVFVTTILNTWAGMFRLGRSRRFVAFAMDLLRSVNEKPGVADCVATIGDIRLFETFLNGDCADISSAVLVSDLGVKRVEKSCFNKQYGNGKKRLFVGSASMEHLPEKGLLVLSGPWGLAISQVGNRQRPADARPVVGQLCTQIAGAEGFPDIGPRGPHRTGAGGRFRSPVFRAIARQTSWRSWRRDAFLFD